MPSDSSRTRVIIAEDNGDLVEALCALIDAEPDMNVVATASRVGELHERMAQHPCEVLVLDLDLHGESSLPALRSVRAAQPGLAVVLYTGEAKGPRVADGPYEHVTKAGDPYDLLAAIRRVAARAAGAG